MALSKDRKEMLLMLGGGPVAILILVLLWPTPTTRVWTGTVEGRPVRVVEMWTGQLELKARLETEGDATVTTVTYPRKLEVDTMEVYSSNRPFSAAIFRQGMDWRQGESQFTAQELAQFQQVLRAAFEAWKNGELTLTKIPEGTHIPPF